MLDSEYYFRLVDYFRQGDIAHSLLLYQEVIEKGFDGQHFITGLSEHLRNLMVALDPATHKLMEVGETFRERFGEQAAGCGLALLLRLLDISNDYEYRYKEAGNKRLFIEVALMKIASGGARRRDFCTSRGAARYCCTNPGGRPTGQT